MWGRIHPNQDIDLYLPLEEFHDIANSELEKVLGCELPTLDGSNSGKSAYLHCEDLNEEGEIRGRIQEGNYFLAIPKCIFNITDEKGHFGQIGMISIFLYIFERR